MCEIFKFHFQWKRHFIDLNIRNGIGTLNSLNPQISFLSKWKWPVNIFSYFSSSRCLIWYIFYFVVLSIQNHTRTNNHGFNLIYTIEAFDNNIRQHVLALSSTLTLISTVEHLSLPPNTWNSCSCMKPLCGLNNCRRKLTKIIFFHTRSNGKGCSMLHLNYIWNITWSLVRLS